MNRTKIEWVRNPDGTQGYAWNPITGCLNHDNGLCKGGGFPCYAYKLANGRLKQRYLANKNWRYIDGGTGYYAENHPSEDPFYPRFWEERMKEMMDRYTQLQCCTTYPPKRGVFVCDMGDLFGIGVPKPWTNQVLDAIRWNGYDRFYILTKQAARLPEFSPFPDNAWVGVTATTHIMFIEACLSLGDIQAKVKYISLEPLLSWGDFPAGDIAIGQWAKGLNLYGIDWLIIGACTGTYGDLWNLVRRLYPDKEEAQFVRAMRIKELSKVRYSLQPKIEWVREIVEAADQAGIPVFLKDNLASLLHETEH